MVYKVIEHHNLSVLIEKVNGKIKNGWQPQGSIAKSHGNDYMQAMIKE